MSKRYAIGVDIGGTNLRVALVSSDGKVIKKSKELTTADARATLKARIKDYMQDGVEGIGIAVAGLIDKDERRVITSPNLNVLDGFSFDELGFDVPVYIENDANAAALGEQWKGAGKKYDSFVLMTLGTGIGGGIVYNGKLLDVPAEIGHMSIKADGSKCPCGNYGCLEMYASAKAITSLATEALEQGQPSLLKECCKGNIYRISPEDILESAFDGDLLSRNILKQAGRYLGVGIANLIHILNPQAIILTGGLVGAWDIYIEEAKHEASKRVLKGLYEKVEVLRSTLADSDDAGVIGAAGLVLHVKRTN